MSNEQAPTVTVSFTCACDACGDTQGMEVDEILCITCKAKFAEAKRQRLAGVRGMSTVASRRGAW